MLDQLIVTTPQAQAMPALDQLIARGDLIGYLAAFLLSCQVEGLASAYKEDYECYYLDSG